MAGPRSAGPLLLLTDDGGIASTMEQALSVRSTESPSLRVVDREGAPMDDLSEDEPLAILIDLDAEEPDPLTVMDLVKRFDPDIPRIAIVSPTTIHAVPDIIELGIDDWIDRCSLEAEPAAVRETLRHRVAHVRRVTDDPVALGVFERFPEGVLYVGGDERIQYANSVVTDLVDIGEDRLVDTPIDSLPLPEDASLVDAIRRSVETGRVETDEIGCPDTDAYYKVTATPYREGALLLVRDVTERKRRERELREKSNFLDELFEQVPINLYVKDDEARHVRMSEHHPRSDEVIGKTDHEVYPDYLSEETYADDMKILETGEEILNKAEYNEPTGEWVLTSKVPWYDEDGEIAGIIGVTRDITDRKEAEEELRRTNARLENFAGIVSHDLRNPLTVASGRLELLEEDAGDLPHLDDIATALDRMEELIEDILLLAREGDEIEQTDPVDLGELIEECRRTVDMRDADLELLGSGTIRADRTRLTQLLENLIRNAVEHGGEAVSITIGATADGFYVADDGPGIPPKDRDDVFTEGFTGSDSGTGIGLAIVRQIVEAHGWEIAVSESEAGGARFEITGAVVDR